MYLYSPDVLRVYVYVCGRVYFFAFLVCYSVYIGSFWRFGTTRRSHLQGSSSSPRRTHSHTHTQTNFSCQYLRSYYGQPQQILFLSSVGATCFGHVDLPRALQYTILKTQVKMRGDILKFAISHKLCTLLQLECKYFAHFSCVLLASIEETNKTWS